GHSGSIAQSKRPRSSRLTGRTPDRPAHVATTRTRAEVPTAAWLNVQETPVKRRTLTFLEHIEHVGPTG
ncbi:MAG: hypothetical protein MN733_27290, partial [Nitrososphaera sp.]|nr:hypothetical protein [Nitrososphaera sp.]